jgi:predicted transcriptional regulator
MAQEERKSKIIAIINETEDDALLAQVEALLASSADWWETLPAVEKEAIERGLRQADEGKLIPHEEAIARFKKWL